MSKSKRIRKSKGQSSKRKKPPLVSTFPLLEKTNWVAGLIFFIGCLLFANTLTHDYTQDDAIVIYDNMYTTQGIQGIPGLLSKDTFFGFFKTEGKSKLVSGGRYRPLTPVMFALEWELFGRSPWIGHLINILLYGLLGVCIYLLFRQLFQFRFTSIDPYLVSALIALLYVVHPVHTEVIANIKGRDEIVTMLGSVLAFFWVLKAQYTSRTKWAWFAGIIFFLALLSKENAIMFMLIVPLTLFFLLKLKWGRIIQLTLPMGLGLIVFLIIRTSILGLDLGGAPQELMNNPFLKLENQHYVPFDFGEKSATILYTLGDYLRLLVFPHPLTHDYYPRHVDIMNFSNWQVWLSLMLYMGLIVLSIRWRKKHPLISLGIWMYLITLFIVSNILFPIGTNMSERFLFMPSLGFAMIIAYLCYLGVRKFSRPRIVVLLMGVFMAGLAAKTIVRNPVWKNDFTLFTTDIKTSKNSAKLLNAAGGALSNEAIKPGYESQKTQMLNDAISYLSRAIEIHPTYKNAYLILGNCYHYLGEYEKATPYYETALQFDSGFKDAIQNMGINYRELGRYYGQQKNDLPGAIRALEKAYSYRSNEFETVRLLGISYGRSGKHQKAIRFFKEAIKLRPDLASGYVNLANAYKNAGNESKAREMFNKALEIDPNALNLNR